jgi:predicted permease
MPRTWLDSLRADAVFGWRQIFKRKITSAAAILSLALAIGACTSAFRLIDALLFRPLPVADPDGLYLLSRQGIDRGNPISFGSWGYAEFRQLQEAVRDQVDLVAVSWVQRMELTFKRGGGPAEGMAAEMEKANIQYVSGWMFGSFGLHPALGRLLTKEDDLKFRSSPVAVLSYDYWTHRFNRDPKVIGRTMVIGRKFGIGNDVFEIVGVAGDGFSGTDPGTVTDIFAPTTMSALASRPEAGSFLKTYVRLPRGAAPEPVRDRLRSAFASFDEQTKRWKALSMDPAPTGVSSMQHDYRQALAAFSVLVALVLLIACANVANLMTAQAAARGREMALRVSIGARRWRMVQLVLVESAIIALLASLAGALFAWWSAPFVVSRINPPGNPARLFLPADWRGLLFSLALTLLVTFLFGLTPALRASSADPATALKGGVDPHSRRRLMHGLVAVQVAFCFLVVFVAGMFAATLTRLSHADTGFSTERVLNIDTVSESAQPAAVWDQLAEHLREMPGVESATLAGWPVLDGYSYMFNALSINDGPATSVWAAFMNVSPGWLATMKIPLLSGRDLLPTDAMPGAVIVNEAFAKQYFDGANPVGKSFAGTSAFMKGMKFQIVGLVGDARYRYLREPVLPTAYLPFHRLDKDGTLQTAVGGTFTVRTASPNPLVLAATLRREVTRSRPGFWVSAVRTTNELIESQTVRERLLAMLALFFAVVALLLAGVGLYGVLDYSVLQRRREIGIRMAIGAQAADIARRVTMEVFTMVLVGALAGLGLGLLAIQYVEALFYQVKATDAGILALPSLAILGAAVLAALPPVIHAVRTDPVNVLRAE